MSANSFVPERDWSSLGHGLPHIRNGYSREVSDAMREILRQYNDFTDFSGDSMRFWGPHYVEYTRGEFFLHPYGDHPDYRYSFECRPEFIPGEAEPLWTFVVL